MDTAAPDPLDTIWSPEERAAGRERCRELARAAALDTIAPISHDLMGDESREVYVTGIVETWLRDFDASVGRAAAILRCPQAVGRERLARQLALHSAHSVEVAIKLLATAAHSDGVSSLPVGQERADRLAAARRGAPLGEL